MIRFGSLFAGIGGFDLAFERAGMQSVFQVEIDKAARSVLDKHFPNTVRFEDVRTVGKHNLPAVDLLCGGFPCQDLSVAGKRAGLAGERSGLWWEFARLIGELNPQWVVAENVPGLLSSNGGRDFAAVQQSLVERGYCVAWRVFDSQYFGLAQRRRRVFIVASLGNGRAAEVLFEREGLRWDTPPRGNAGKGVAGSLKSRADSSPRGDSNDNIVATTFTVRSGCEGGGKGYLGLEDGAMTLGGQPQYLQTFCMAQGQGNAEVVKDGEPSLTCNHEQPIVGAPFVGVRRLTPTEAERLQGFNDGWTAGQSDSARYKQLGNAVSVPVVEWIGKRIVEVENANP